MPYVNVKLTRGGVTRQHKQRLVEKITQALVDELGKAPEHIHVVIDLIDDENWGYAGMLTDDYRRSVSG